MFNRSGIKVSVTCKQNTSWHYSHPYAKDTPEKVRCTGNQYHIRMVFKTKHTISSSLVNTTPDRDLLDMRHCVNSTPCECGRNYFGKMGNCLGYISGSTNTASDKG
jgi:hypothetical protein